MKTGRFEKHGIDVPMLGFGSMRMPRNEDGTMNYKKCEDIIDKAYANGIRYFDTAYGYCGGESEIILGKSLSKYPRESYYIADKLPSWLITSREKAEEIFEEQLKKCGVDYFDFYLLHTLEEKKWNNNILKHGIVDFVIQKQKEGKIKYLGFSFHDRYQVFEEIINYHDWDFCQIQLNYLDTELQAGMRGYELAEKKGIPLVIMEPVKGGLLAKLPEKYESVFKSIRPDKSIASWAMRFLADKENIKVILSGMSDDDMLFDNLDTFNNYIPLTDTDKKAIDTVATMLKQNVKNGCTQCGYCMPCPKGVNIPKIFNAWNMYGIFGEGGSSKHQWHETAQSNALPENCIGCGKCETMCPQSIAIRADLKRSDEEMNSWINK